MIDIRAGARWRLVALALALTATGCAHGINYPGPVGPRFAGDLPASAAANAPADRAAGEVRVVTFNTKFASKVDSTIALMRLTPTLERPDILALQEVDAVSVERIARSLDMRYVYYPATRHPKSHRDFGNAVLSQWPIQDDRRIPLPHLGRFRKTERVATAATVSVDGTPIRVYSAHLGMFIEVGFDGKKEQVAAILADAAAYDRVIVLGDMNSHAIGKAFREAGYDWPTEHNPDTIFIWNWDHLFMKGMSLAHDQATGVVEENRGASDHRPVWAVISPTSAPGEGPEAEAPRR